MLYDYVSSTYTYISYQPIPLILYMLSVFSFGSIDYKNECLKIDKGIHTTELLIICVLYYYLQLKHNYEEQHTGIGETLISIFFFDFISLVLLSLYRLSSSIPHRLPDLNSRHKRKPNDSRFFHSGDNLYASNSLTIQTMILYIINLK